MQIFIVLHENDIINYNIIKSDTFHKKSTCKHFEEGTNSSADLLLLLTMLIIPFILDGMTMMPWWCADN